MRPNLRSFFPTTCGIIAQRQMFVNSENQKENEKTGETKQVNRKKTIGLVILVVLISVIVGVVIFNLNDFNSTVEEMKKLNPSYLGWAGLCIVLYLALWPLSLCLIARINKTKAKFIDSYLIGGSEHFFNAITPFSTNTPAFLFPVIFAPPSKINASMFLFCGPL